MPQTYFAILTAVGEAKDANAKALGVPLVITEMAVGDGNGAVPVPDRTRTTLVHQVRRAPLNQLSRDPVNTSQVIAEQVIPENVGGWWIREIGLYDQDGDLIAIANCPPTYKPELAEGSGRTQVVRMVLIVSSADSVQLKIDPAVVLATRKYADDAITASMNAHLAAADPHPQYLTSAEGDAKINDHKADVDPHPQYLTSAEGDTKIAAAVAALVNSSPAALDTLAELATALNNDPNFATTITNALAAKAPLDSPALTGTPTAPTTARFDNSQKLVTTAAAKAAGFRHAATVVISAATVLDATYSGKVVCFSGTTPYTVTLPSRATFPDGETISFWSSNPSTVTIARAGGDTIYPNNAGITSIAMGNGDTLVLENSTNVGGWLGIAGSAVSAIGIGQTWNDYTASRALNTTYTNTTGKPIMVSVNVTNSVSSSTCTLGITIQNITGIGNTSRVAGSAGNDMFNVTAIVPPGASYQVVATQANLNKWNELR